MEQILNKAQQTIKYADQASHETKCDSLDRQANRGSGESLCQ